MGTSRFALGHGWFIEMATASTIRIVRQTADGEEVCDISRDQWAHMVHFLTVEHIALARIHEVMQRV